MHAMIIMNNIQISVFHSSENKIIYIEIFN